MTYPPPGWYADPDNPHDLRWWDGYAWIPTAPAVGVAPARPAAPAAAPASPGGGGNRSALGPVLGALATLAVIGLTSAVIVLATRDNGNNAAAGGAPSGQQSGVPSSGSRPPSAAGSSSPTGAPFALHQSCDIDAHGLSYTATLTNHTGKQVEVDGLTTAFFTVNGAEIATETMTLHQVIVADQRVGISSKPSHKKPPAGSSTCSEIAAQVISDGDDLNVNWPVPQ